MNSKLRERAKRRPHKMARMRINLKILVRVNKRPKTSLQMARRTSLLKPILIIRLRITQKMSSLVQLQSQRLPLVTPRTVIRMMLRLRRKNKIRSRI